MFLVFMFMIQQEIAGVLEEPLDGQGSTPLPVLCVEDGMVILRFSEIFGIHEPLKKADKREHGYFTHRGMLPSINFFIFHLCG